MSYTSETQDIETYLNDNWTATPIEFGNVPYEQNGKDWIRLQIFPLVAEQQGLNSCWRYEGTVFLTIFSSVDDSVKASNSYADTLTSLLRSKTINNNITFKTPLKRVLGQQEGWFQQTVEVDYFRYEN